MAYVKKQLNIDNIKKNEYGQYIVDGLNNHDRHRLYKATEHPCDRYDEFKCLDCPYTDCLAPHHIAYNGSVNYNNMTDGIAGVYDSPYAVRSPFGGKRGSGTRELVQNAIAMDTK